MPRSLRVGVPPYLVNRPLDLGLAEELGTVLAVEVPSRLIERLRAGELDVVLTSSIELFLRPGYRWLDGAAVMGRGAVSSVQLFLRRPFEQVRRVVLDPASRSAQVLARIVLTRELAPHTVSFHEAPLGVLPEDEAGRSDADAWLAIGDPALCAAITGQARTWNPVAAWHAAFGLPFPFAVWIVRPGIELDGRELSAFAAARDRGLSHIDELACDASLRWGLPLEACRRYLRDECSFSPGAELRRALFTLRDAAAELGLAERHLEPTSLPLSLHVAQAG